MTTRLSIQKLKIVKLNRRQRAKQPIKATFLRRSPRHLRRSPRHLKYIDYSGMDITEEDKNDPDY